MAFYGELVPDLDFEVVCDGQVRIGFTGTRRSAESGATAVAEYCSVNCPLKPDGTHHCAARIAGPLDVYNSTIGLDPTHFQPVNQGIKTYPADLN